MGDQFQVDLRAVVDLLARHVYSSPRVFVRELLQNGVDAVTARLELDPDAPRGPIVVRPADAGGDGALLVEDPGIGLTVDEVRELLATIGGSSKRDELDLPRQGFLGRFGIGLLSCFVVADRIEVLTRSARGTAPVRFIGHDDGTYDVAELTEDDPDAPEEGTVVRIAPRPGASEWVSAAVVERLARQYGSALPVPVLLHRADGTVTEVTEPDLVWHGLNAGDDRRVALGAWCERHFDFTPLDVIPLRAPSVGASGAAFVLPSTTSQVSGAGHRTYLKRMLLADDLRGVLPGWAFFVRAVLDVGELQPTASREALVDDDALEEAQEELGACIREWLVRLGTTNPERLAQILGVHDLAARALAAEDDEVFAALGQWLPFESSDGWTTLPELVRQSGVIRYTPTVERFRLLSPIARAQGLVVVNGGYTYHETLLQKAHVVVPGAETVLMEDQDIVATLDPVDAERERVAEAFLRIARTALDEVGCEVDLRRFDPEVVPALLLVDDATRNRLRMRSTAENVDDEWAALLGDLDDGGPARPLLVCNDRHALVRRLVAASADAGGGASAGVVRTSVQALYVQAMLLGHHPMGATDLALLNRALLDLVDGVLPET